MNIFTYFTKQRAFLQVSIIFFKILGGGSKIRIDLLDMKN